MKKAFLVITSVIILLVCIGNIFTPDKDFSDNENRTLAGLPSFSFKSMLNGEMSSEFESYAADQFFMRDMWVSAKAHLEKITGKKENNGVYFAKNGFLIEVPDYDMDVVNSNIKSIEGLNNVKSTLLLIPTAYEILKDKLPLFSYTDIQRQIIDLAQNSLNVICPIDTLNENKDEYIYFKTDHHQTAFGSHLVYTDFCKAMGFTPIEYYPQMLSQDFYGSTWSKAALKNIQPDTISTVKSKVDCTVTINDSIITNDIYDYDKLETKDKYAVFLGGNYGKAVIETTANTEKNVLIIKDSYANGLIPYLINHYSKIIMLDLRYYNHSVKELISEEKLDEIIYIYNISTFATDDNLKKINF